MKTSQWPHQPRVCASFLLMGVLPPLLLFPHTFPENLHSFNSFERTCGSLHTGLCDVVNPRSDLQWKHPESDLQCSPFKWFIAPTCRPLAVSVLAFACLHKLPQGQIWSENLVFLGRKNGGIGNPASEWNSRSGKGSCSSLGRAWCWQIRGHGFDS